MIIGIDISAIPYGTGVSEYTKQLVLHLLQVDKVNQYKLFFGSFRQKLPRDFISIIKKSKNCKLYTYPLPPKILDVIWNRLHILSMEFLIGKCDVFHTSDWTQPPTLGAKTVSTIHDLTPFLYPKWHNQKVVSAHTLKIQRAISTGSKFISVSKNTQEDLKKLFEQDSEIIYEAADASYLPIKKPSSDYFLVSATREPRKNLENILKAFSILQNKHPSAKLKIAGKYGWGKDIEPISGVEILGYVTDRELLKLHQNAFALIYPSLYEGFGLPILKSLNCHIPVITSNISSLPEITGKAGLLINPRDPTAISKAMGQLLADKILYNKLKQSCLLQSKKYSWEKTAMQTLMFYKKI